MATLHTQPTMPWKFGISSTLKGIYVIRYLLFSGGSAIAGSMVQRIVGSKDVPVIGIVVGLIVGLLAFRGQLRPLSWPKLMLSQTTLRLIQRKRVVELPWEAISGVGQVADRIAVSLKAPMTAPNGDVVEQIQLEPLKFGASPGVLGQALEQLSQSEALRSRLPSDEQVKSAL
jgi:hypothetical protein